MWVEDQPLLGAYDLGHGLRLRNRVVMAPMTRARAANPALVPTELHTEYYRQRAGAGLIVSEGTWISTDVDPVSFAALFISNPDLPVRFERRLPLAEGDRDTFYQGGAGGLIDYPSARRSSRTSGQLIHFRARIDRTTSIGRTK